MKNLPKKNSYHTQLLKVTFFAASFIALFSNPILASPKGSNPLADLEDALVSLADRVRPSVVSLSPYVPPSPSIRRQGDSSGVPANAASGVIIDGARGIIVTNNHVVRGSGKVKVTLFDGVEKVGTVLFCNLIVNSVTSL